MTDEEVLGYIEEYRETKGRDPMHTSTAVRSLGKFCGGLGKAVDADERCIADWLNSLEAEKAPRTTIRYKRCCGFFFDFLLRKGAIGASPLTAPEKSTLSAWRKAYDEALSNGYDSVELMEDCLTSKAISLRFANSHRRSLARLSEWMGGYDRVLACDPDDIAAFLDDMGKRNLDASQAYSSLRTYFEFALRLGVIGEDPMARLRYPKPRRRPSKTRLEVGDIIKLLEYLEGQAHTERAALVYAVVSLVVHEGLGPSAFADLDVSSYSKDGDRSYLVVGPPQAGIIEICPESTEALDRYLSYRWDRLPDQPLFAHRKQGGIRRYSKESFCYFKLAAMKEAGVYRRGVSLLGSRNDLILLGRESADVVIGEARRSGKRYPASELISELDLQRGTTFEQRLEYGRLTRSDTVRGILPREDIEAALAKWPGAEVFDAVVRYDGVVVLEPRDT